jgi:hypothetical protein
MSRIPSIKRSIILLYLMVIVFHVAHIMEEVWGQFLLIRMLGGLSIFLLINWILLLIPMFLFYFVILDKKWAYYLSVVYVVIMIVNGIGHNIGTLISRRYFNGYAGGFSGFGLVLSGIPLLYFLLSSLRKRAV